MPQAHHAFLPHLPAPGTDGPARPAPPRRVEKLLPREALLQQLTAARRARCIVLQGAAGSGKTTLLDHWRKALVPLGFDVAWAGMTAADDEPAQFLEDLFASLAQMDPAIVREAVQIADRGDDRGTLESVVIALVQGLARHGRELSLFIDDAHHLGNPLLLDGALQLLLEYAPDNFHLVLASRRAVPLALGRLRAQGQLLELDMRDLRFSPAETAQFLRQQFGDMSPHEALRLHGLCDGWVAGLQLLVIHLRQHPAARVPLHGYSVEGPASFAAYFEREVLSGLSSGEIDNLVRLSLCTRFCASLVAVLLPGAGMTPALTTASELIARLEQDNLFITPLDDSPHGRWYRLHPLLREALLGRSPPLPSGERRALNQRAADWFENAGLLEEAVHHRLAADQQAQAVELVARCIDDIYFHGDLRSVANVLRKLPPQIIAGDVRLHLWQARLHLQFRQMDACQRTMAQLSLAIPAGDSLNRFRLALVQCGWAMQRDDSDAAERLRPALEQLPAGAAGWMDSGRRNLLAWIHISAGRYEQARQVLREGPSLLANGKPLLGSSFGVLGGRCMQGLSHEMQGQMIQAERCFRDVLHEAQALGNQGTEPASLAAALLGWVLYERNEVQAACELLEPRLDILERVSIPDTVLRVLLMLSRAHALAGRQLEALGYAERLEDYASLRGLDRLLAYALARQTELRLQRLEFQEADALMARLFAIEDRCPQRTGTAADIRMMAEYTRVLNALAHGQLEPAGALLTPLIADCAQRGRRRRVAQFQLVAGVIAYRCARPESARVLLLDALRLGHELGLARTLLDAHPDAVALIEHTVANAPMDPVVAFYVQRLLQADAAVRQAQRPAATPVSRITTETLSERETEVLHLLALAMPNKRIARALGLSIETVKWHLRKIYKKLDVMGRDEAVARARDLGLPASAAGNTPH